MFAGLDVGNRLADVLAVFPDRITLGDWLECNLVADRNVHLGGQAKIRVVMCNDSQHICSGLQAFNNDNADCVFLLMHQKMGLAHECFPLLETISRSGSENIRTTFAGALDLLAYKSYIRHMTQIKPENNMQEKIIVRHENSPREQLGFRPLYRQVKDNFLKRIIDGVWLPGTGLPSEGQLAQELGVSQGTVRKALDEMSAENLLVRRQGRGTYVAEHDEKRILFQFFKLTPDREAPRFPDSRLLTSEEAKATADERALFDLEPGAKVYRFRRLRLLDNKPLLVEDISLPSALFPGLAMNDIPNNLYSLYAMRYGITIASAREKLKAVSLGEDDAALLGVDTEHAALLIDRLAVSVSGIAVEWRRSLCLTDDAHYLSDLK